MSAPAAPARSVALLRGINVGRAKRVAMADLRDLLTRLGYGNVRTLLNSGNAVFDVPAKLKTADHAGRIRTAVASELGVDALVLVKSARDIAAAVAGNPLAGVATDPSRLLVAFAQDARSLAAVKALAEGSWGDEQLHVGSNAAYLWCANGILQSKLAVALLRDLGPSGTTRNWATVEKLHAMLST
ncbi:MAG: DUF1697 domain-containing protein [Burkholderiales bacterium]|nr:DUF1697 domain-containing protein [Burkholderiales bacterium]